MNRKVLFVDDDVNVLSGLKRGVRKQFEAAFATSGHDGLVLLAETGPFAAVVSDLRMPSMDGIEFLSRVREQSPDTVRLMLSGYADVDAAILAVNEGNIFRFLTKPVQNDMLVKSLQAALELYSLITAEHELLCKTLTGSVDVLIDVLSLINPVAFSRGSRLKRYVRHITTRLQIPDAWQILLAAKLSQLGCVTLPPDTLDKVYASLPLSAEEEEMFASHPQVAHQLLVNIPRLESIADMIARQLEPFNKDNSGKPPKDRDVVTLGAHILKVALDFDKLIISGATAKAAIKQLREHPDQCDPAIVNVLEDLEMVPDEMAIRSVNLRDLRTGMMLYEDIRTTAGTLLVAKGQGVNFTVLERLRHFAKTIDIVEPVRVLAPVFDAEQPDTAQTVGSPR